MPLTVSPSLAGGGITLVTSAVSFSTYQYSLGSDGSCNFASVPSHAICNANKNVVPSCPTPANIAINGACVTASGQYSYDGAQGPTYAVNGNVTQTGSAKPSSRYGFQPNSITATTLAGNSSGAVITPSNSISETASSTRASQISDHSSVSLSMSITAITSQIARISPSLNTSSPTPTSLSSQTSAPIVASIVSSSARPSSLFGSPSGNYSLANCANSLLPNPDSPDYMTKCGYSNCQAIKTDAITYWHHAQAPKNGLPITFLDQITYYMGPTNGMYCDAEYSLLGCTDAGACTSYNWPGAWLLVREMIQFTQFYRTIYQGFAGNYATTLGLCTVFGKTFSPVDQTDTLWEKILTAIAGLFGGQMLAVIFRKILFFTIGELAAENAEYITQLKLFTTNIASGGAAIGINLNQP